jgi:hypothetical protein
LQTSKDLIDTPRAFSGKSTTAPDLMEFHQLRTSARSAISAVQTVAFLSSGETA